MSSLLTTFLSDTTIDAAYSWLCKNRKHYPPNSDIWDLRFHWDKEREEIKQTLSLGCYQFKPLQLITKNDNTTIALWGSKDALVIKMLTMVLAEHLPVHNKCEHIKGNGGGKRSALNVDKILRQGDYRFVCRTDIKGYYANINKSLLLAQLNPLIKNNIIYDLLVQFINYSVEEGGNFHTPKNGISRGSSLSPLIGAFHLYIVDLYFSQIEKHLLREVHG